MGKNERRKLIRTLGQLVDLAESTVDQKGVINKVQGDGWLAWLYRPAGPGSETIHVEFRIGADFTPSLVPEDAWVVDVAEAA